MLAECFVCTVIEAVLVYLLYADIEGQLVVIANTHILFNPKRGDIKVPIEDHACKHPPLSQPLKVACKVLLLSGCSDPDNTGGSS